MKTSNPSQKSVFPDVLFEDWKCLVQSKQNEFATQWPEIQDTWTTLEEHLFQPFFWKNESESEWKNKNWDEIWMVWSCSQSVPRAEKRIVQIIESVEPAIRKWKQTSDQTADLIQELLQKMLLDSETHARKILNYNGKASLAVWIKTIAIRMVIDQHRSSQNTAKVQEESLLVTQEQPEMLLLKKKYASECEAALKEAWRALPSRQKSLLRFSSLQGMSFIEIAKIYRIHRVTAARWVEEARYAFAMQSLNLLSKRVQLDVTELKSMLYDMQSQIQLSLEEKSVTESLSRS